MPYRLWGYAVIAVWATGLLAQETIPLKVTQLRGRAFVVEGGRTPGGTVNTGFVIGDKGVIAIDAQASPAVAAGEVAEIARITARPVDTVILTHSDSDHINGLPGFPRNVTVVAQENAATEMKAILTDPHPRGGPVPPQLKDYLPGRTVRGTADMVVDGVRLTLIHVASGHTDGDLIIYIPSQRIVFAGDLLTIGDPGIPDQGRYPIIHLNKNGSSAGWIRSMNAILALDADIFVGGHGNAVRDRATLAAWVKTVEERRTAIVRLFDAGKSLAEIKATLGEAGAPGRWPTFTETTYQELLQR